MVVFLIVALGLLVSTPVYPHGGGLDAYGCHHNRKQGGYHCHRGEFAGQSFTSQQEMLQKLKEGSARKTEKGKEKE
jgi:hypothetical protein